MEIQRRHQNKETKKKVVVTGDSMLNGISRKGLSKSHKVTVENVLGETGKTIVDDLDQMLN